MLCCFSQEKKFVLVGELTKIQEIPTQIIISRTNLGKYERISDTIKLANNLFYYEKLIGEPNFVNVTVKYASNRPSSIDFWVFPGKYQLEIDNDMKVSIKNKSNSSFIKAIDELDGRVIIYRKNLDSLVKLVKYDARNIEKFKTKLNFIRDSVENSIDENIYRFFAVNNLNTPEGLYALCKYAEKNQRIKFEFEKIQKLLNQFSKSIKALPSAKILTEKLKIAERMQVGNYLQDITLADTADKMVSISDYQGKYVLVEFWASWCGPCRDENPRHILAKQKYKEDFQVIYITLDERKEKKWWLQAIYKDGIEIMPQLSDFNKLAREKYDIRVIPFNFLLDSKGKIIAVNLRGDGLDKELKKVFKY